MDRDRGQTLGDLERKLLHGKDLLAELAEAPVEGLDDDGVVVATADGLGRVIDLRISEAAARHPQRVGARVTAAVKRARRAGASTAEEHQATRFPDLPSLADVRDAMSPPPQQTDLRAVDYPGSADVRNAIAEGMEVRQQVERACGEFDEHRVRQEIGVNAGTVVTDGAGRRVRIEIRPEAVNNVGAQRLAGQIVEALRRADERAEQYRMSTLDQIIVGDTAVGALIRDARRATADERERR